MGHDRYLLPETIAGAGRGSDHQRFAVQGGDVRRGRGGGLREIMQPKLIALAQDHGAGTPVFSSWRMLPGQSSCEKMRHGLAADAGDGAVPSALNAPGSSARDAGMSSRPQPQRRIVSGNTCRPIEQVFAERTALSRGRAVCGCRGNDADVDLIGLRRDGFDGAFLQRAQQFHLCGQRQLADFVEKQRAAGSFRRTAHVTFGGAGEGALLVTEQDRFHEIVGDRAALTATNGLALRSLLRGWRRANNSLPTAGFALDQHRNAGRGRLLRGARTPAMVSLRVMMSARSGGLPRLWRIPRNSPFKACVLSDCAATPAAVRSRPA